VVVRRRMRRETVIAFAGKLPGCVVAMEACCGAHHLGHILAGHQVRLMSPECVRPYVKAQKNDDRDAASLRRGLASYRATRLRVGSLGCSASRSVAAATCASS
jgi:transposase